jgi:gentisate 1,2-dioxygenase
VMPTIRCQFHRLQAGAKTLPRRDVGSSVFQVFDGAGSVVFNGQRHDINIGDIFVVPSWIEWTITTEAGVDLFHFSDAPIMEKLGFNRGAV